jgi:GrpB-like predicted nucleotidyltransferase (UPF0157 family)
VSKLEFAFSDRFFVEVTAMYREHEGRIRARLPEGEIRHRGGTSVPGVLTSGDVDIHVRVDGRSFDSARELLATLYVPFHEEAWTPDESAFFYARDSYPPVEIALTVRGCRDDVHHGEAWDRIAADANLITRYNDLKRASGRHVQHDSWLLDARRAGHSATVGAGGSRRQAPRDVVSLSAHSRHGV